MSRTAWIVLVVVLLLFTLACAVACLALGAVFVYRGATVTEVVPVPGRFVSRIQETVVSEVAIRTPATLEVRNPWGNVTIRAGEDTDRIEVVATKEARTVSLPQGERLLQQVVVLVEGNGTRSSVWVTGLEDFRFGTVTVNLDITVPDETDVIVLNEAGNVHVEGTRGSIRVRSDAGNIRIRDVTVTEYVDVQNSAGNVDFEGRVLDPDPDPLPWEVALRTSAGIVRFAVPMATPFTVDAETEVGSVISDFELEDLQTGGTVGQWLKGGANMTPISPNVILRSAAGNIRIEPLP